MAKMEITGERVVAEKPNSSPMESVSQGGIAVWVPGENVVTGLVLLFMFGVGSAQGEERKRELNVFRGGENESWGMPYPLHCPVYARAFRAMEGSLYLRLLAWKSAV